MLVADGGSATNVFTAVKTWLLQVPALNVYCSCNNCWLVLALMSPAKLYTFEQYFLKNSSQGSRLHGWLEEAWLPAYTRLTGQRAALVMDAVVAEHLPQVAVVAQWDSFAQWQDSRASMRADADIDRKSVV